jgi:hypothetical protein
MDYTFAVVAAVQQIVTEFSVLRQNKERLP